MAYIYFVNHAKMTRAIIPQIIMIETGERLDKIVITGDIVMIPSTMNKNKGITK